MWNRKKLIRLITAAFIILFMMTVITGPKSQAASLTARNNKAHRVLKKKYNSIYRKHMDITYKYYDVTGDGIHELLMDCYPSSSGGSGHVIYIFQAKGSKAKCILKTTEYGLERISFYKKSKSLVMSMYGHGGELPAKRLLRIVGDVPASQIHRRVPGVVQLDPVAVVAVGVRQAGVVFGHDLAQAYIQIAQPLLVQPEGVAGLVV